MKLLPIISLLFLFLFSTSIPAKKNSRYKYQNEYQVPVNQKVKTSVWAKHIKKSMEDKLCAKEGQFKKCFNISKGQCRLEVGKHYSHCIKPIKKMKYVSPQNREGIRLATNIGLCIGKRYEQSNKNTKKSIKGC